MYCTARVRWTMFTSLTSWPSLVCPNIFTPPDANENYATVYWPIPRSMDVDGDPAAVTCNLPRGGKFEGQISIVQCTAVDTSNRERTTTCQLLIAVTPRFNRGCPPDISQENSMVTFAKPIGEQNFAGGDLSPVECSHESGDVFEPGLTLVNCTAIDTSINLEATCSFKVSIGTLPKFANLGSCGDAAIVNTAPDDGQNTATAITGRWTRPTKDGGGDVVCDPDPDTHTFVAGVTTVTCMVADSNVPSLIDTCSFKVRVFPTFPNGCPETIISANGMDVDFTPPNAIDSVSSTIPGTCDKASNDTFESGETTVRCSAMDSVETTQTVTCSFVVAVGTPPDFDSRGSCDSSPVNVPPDEGKMTATGIVGQWTRPTRAGGGQATCSPDPDTTTFVGDRTEVACTIQNDQAPSITTTCTFDVGVFPAFEKDTLLGNPFRSPDPGANYATYAYLDPLAKDSNGASLPVVCSPMSGAQFGGGTHEIQCIATDASANQDSTYTFNLTVAPVFKTLCPNDIIQATNPVSFPVPIGGDDPRGKPFPVTCTKNDRDVFNPGTTVVICTVTDPVTKLVATCSFTVTIVVAPTFDASPACDEDYNTEPAPGENRAIAVTWPERAATQADGNPANVTCEPVPGSDFEAGDTNVTCTAADTRLPPSITPTTDCVFRVRVYPTFVEGCPNNIIQIPDDSGPSTIVNFEIPEAAIDSGGKQAANVTCDPTSGSAFRNDNETVVTCTAIDSVTLGEATCSFTIRFLAAPTFNATPPCDENVNVPPAAGENMAVAVTWPKRAATQEDGNPAMVTCEPSRGSNFPGGNNTVTCMAVDERAPDTLQTTCDFQVRVYPTFVTGCPADIVEAPESGGTTLVEFQIPEGAPDSTGAAANVTCEPPSGSSFANNVATEVTCTAIDSDNATFPSPATCTFKVIVGIAPTFAKGCPADIVVAPDENGQATVTWDEITGNEDSTGQPAEVNCDHKSGNTFNQTETLVTCIATDAGTTLTANCTFRVILDSEPPILDCPNNFNITANPGTNTANVTWDTPVVTDNYTPQPDIRVACIPETATFFPYGVTRVVCYAADSLNNVGTCSFEVEITGANCVETCPGNSVCMLQEDGESVCVCNQGYTGPECTNVDECASSPCHSNAICSDLAPPDFYSCECQEGFYGDGTYSCERYFPPEYPDILLPGGAYDLKKLFLVVLAIADPSTSDCNPDVDTMSFECSTLVRTFKELVLPLYKKVSKGGFLDIKINQTDLRKGSVLIPHTVSYNYSDAAIREMQPAVFYARSVQPDVEAGRVGSLQLDKSCKECTSPKDITSVCVGVDEETIVCPDKSVLTKESDASSGLCIYKCVSICEEDSSYCNGGVCSQKNNEDAECSECPEGTTGPRCTPVGPTEVPPDEPNIPLIVGLSVGIGGILLLIVILNMLYCALRGRCSKKNLQAGEENGIEAKGVDNFQSISMDER
ncbi:hyalin-like isoform X2 [Acanthaster planci]|uniref:Hyalin-like isoform X2 n=1 Tax=Acanthaster planci TaxID=133434 RepID=A0A8B8A1V1_ACAPL|nr:hyalin-like isoform X2 [Acanthaster planci]